MNNVPKDPKKYVLNFHRIRKLKGRILLITEQGGWFPLEKRTYDRLIRHEISENELKKFEDLGITITLQNIDKIINTEYRRKHFLFYPPALHIIIPTLRCNHQCVYCHSSAKKEGKEFDMTPETAKKAVEFILSVPRKQLNIEIQGGEGLLNLERIKQINDYAKELAKKKNKRVRLSLVTNSTLLGPETLAWVKENKISLTTSLDGPAEVHDKNRLTSEGKATHDVVVNKIRFCKENGVNVGALMVTTRHSLRVPEKIVDEYIDLGFRMMQIKYLNRIGFAEEEWENIGYTAEEYLEFWKKAMEHIIKRNMEGKKITERLTQLMLKKIIAGYEPGFLDFRNPCGTAVGQIAYSYDGKIYSCDEGRGFDLFNLGNVHNTSFKEYMASKETQNLVSATILESTACDACAYKPYCGNCPVINYAEQHNLIPKIATNTRCKIIKGQFDWLFEKLIEDKEARKVFISWIKNG